MKAIEIRRNLHLCIFWLIGTVFVSCTAASNDKSKGRSEKLELTEYSMSKSVVTGNSRDHSTFDHYYLMSRFGIEKILIDSNQFTASLDHNFPMIVELMVAFNTTYPIYVTPGDSIHLEYYNSDLQNNFNRITFTGNHSFENNLLLELKPILKFDDNTYDAFYNTSEELFLHKLDSIETIANAILNSYRSESVTDSSSFVSLTKNFIDFKIAGYLEKYPIIMEHSFKQGRIELSDHYMDRKRSYDLNDSTQLNNIAFNNYAFDIVQRNVSKLFYGIGYDKNGRSNPDVGMYFAAIDSIFDEKEVVDYLKYRSLVNEVYMGNSVPEEFLLLFKESNTLEIYLSKLDQLSNGYSESSIDYKFQDADGNYRYLSEFKGKIIYMDIWATWCGPCHQERVYFEELIDKFGKDNEDIVFIGISLDTDIVKWKNRIGYEEMKGVQFILTDGFNSDLCKDFSIAAIPRFILVGRDRNVVESNAIYPSDKEAFTYLNNLIE